MDEDGLCNILGWILIAFWIVVYSPQLLEIYARQSGEGLSVLFVVIWLLGGITNLLGVMIAALLPTVIVVALYYATCDLVLLFRICFYRWKRTRLAAQTPPLGTRPLLPNEETPEGVISWKTLVIKYITLAFVLAVGLTAWEDQDRGYSQLAMEGKRRWVGQMLGWSSAVLFLGIRVPEIRRHLWN